MKNLRSERGFTLIEAILSIFLAGIFFLVVSVQTQLVTRFQRRSAQLQKALTVAINTMENLKIQENPVIGVIEKTEGRMLVVTQVEEFSSSLYKCRVVVKDEHENEVLSLQTLRRR